MFDYNLCMAMPPMADDDVYLAQNMSSNMVQ